MIDYALVQIEGMALHRVGHKLREEANFVSDRLISVTPELTELLLDYFLTPFTKVSEVYRFQAVEGEPNTMQEISAELFEQPTTLLESSVKILDHLFEQSDHPHIKDGELFVTRFSELVYEDEITEAIGIFKSERKDNFFQIRNDENALKLVAQQGVHPGKLDKGCLVIRTAESDGFRVLTVDNNKYDAQYWKAFFLGIGYAEDHNYQTKQYVEMVKDFSTEIIAKEQGKTEQLNFLNESVKYLSDNPVVDMNEFAESLFEKEETRAQFANYRESFEEDHAVVFPDEFKVSPPVLKDQKRKLKNQINLDTNIQIKINFENTESSKRFIERGYDAEKDMYFYKVFFNEEIN